MLIITKHATDSRFDFRQKW